MRFLLEIGILCEAGLVVARYCVGFVGMAGILTYLYGGCFVFFVVSFKAVYRLPGLLLSLYGLDVLLMQDNRVAPAIRARPQYILPACGCVEGTPAATITSQQTAFREGAHTCFLNPITNIAPK